MGYYSKAFHKANGAQIFIVSSSKVSKLNRKRRFRFLKVFIKKNKGSDLVLESAYNSQKTQFDLVMLGLSNQCFTNQCWRGNDDFQYRKLALPGQKSRPIKSPKRVLLAKASSSSKLGHFMKNLYATTEPNSQTIVILTLFLSVFRKIISF